MPETKKSKVREYAETLIIALAIALFVRTFVVQAFKIPSSSMEPTLLVGDHILVNKFIYGIRIPVIGEKILPDGGMSSSSSTPGIGARTSSNGSLGFRVILWNSGIERSTSMIASSKTPGGFTGGIIPPGGPQSLTTMVPRSSPLTPSLSWGTTATTARTADIGGLYPLMMYWARPLSCIGRGTGTPARWCQRSGGRGSAALSTSSF